MTDATIKGLRIYAYCLLLAGSIKPMLALFKRKLIIIVCHVRVGKGRIRENQLNLAFFPHCQGCYQHGLKLNLEWRLGRSRGITRVSHSLAHF